LKEFPQNLDILTHLVMSLYPAQKENAREIIECLSTINEYRYLADAEYHALGSAWLLQDNPERAREVFEEAYRRYPHDIRFAYLIAQCLFDRGYEDQAFEILKEYTKRAGKHFDVLYNTAVLAGNTGCLDEAIRFLSWAFPKATDPNTRGSVRCQLWQLRRERGDNPKEILREVVEYGRTVEGVVASEARFLTMWLTSPHIPGKEQDDEIRAWITEFQRRLADFSQKHPRYRGLMTFRFPENAGPEETRDTFLGQLASVMLPGMLVRVPGELAARCQPFPLVFRASFAFAAHSVFHYWNQCVSSRDYEHAIHIWNVPNDLQKEHKVALHARRICVDLSALLTLVELDLLQYLAGEFEEIVLARGTKVALDEERLSFLGPHPYAKKIEDWWIKHKSRVRVMNRFYDERSLGDSDFYKRLESGFFVKADVPINVALGKGVGQSLLLAQHESIPLYSDESAIRAWAFADYHTEAYGTLRAYP
jgi:tetratricopeptide (TPR) repeat protein